MAALELSTRAPRSTRKGLRSWLRRLAQLSVATRSLARLADFLVFEQVLRRRPGSPDLLAPFGMPDSAGTMRGVRLLLVFLEGHANLPRGLLEPLFRT